jgi:hypothetical protein
MNAGGVPSIIGDIVAVRALNTVGVPSVGISHKSLISR